MNHALSSVATTRNLSADAQAALVLIAQDVPVTLVPYTDDDGETRQRKTYGTSAAADAAMSELTAIFLPQIFAHARKAEGQKLMTYDDAVSLLLEVFVEKVRSFTPAPGKTFYGAVQGSLAWSISDAKRSSNLVSVPARTAAEYWSIVHEHNGDMAAAFATCQTTANGMAPFTFLAIHRALSTVESTDHADDEDGSTLDVPADEAGPEDQAVAAILAEQLLAMVDETQNRITRLQFGFGDTATRNLLAAWNDDADNVILPVGSQLTDLQIGELLGMARSTVNRQARKAITTMRDAYRESMQEA